MWLYEAEPQFLLPSTSIFPSMDLPKNRATCISNGCKDPPAPGKCSCQKHLDQSKRRAAKWRELQKTAKEELPDGSGESFSQDYAPLSHPALQPLPLNKDTMQSAKRRRPVSSEDGDSSEEEADKLNSKVSDQGSPGGSHLICTQLTFNSSGRSLKRSWRTKRHS